MKKSAADKRKPQTRQEMDDIFAELRTEYLETFTEKQNLIKTSWEKRDRTTIENEFHKMKGTGKTYGLPEITDLGRMLELVSKDNHPKLGTCVFAALELLPQIVAARQQNKTYPLDTDPFYKKIKEIYCELATLAS